MFGPRTEKFLFLGAQQWRPRAHAPAHTNLFPDVNGVRKKLLGEVEEEKEEEEGCWRGKGEEEEEAVTTDKSS